MSAQVPEPRRVVVTGLGWATPLGLEPAEVWAALLAGRSAVVAERWSLPSGPREVPVARLPVDPEVPRHVARLDRFARLGWHAAMTAWEDAGRPQPGRGRGGVWLGAGFGGVATLIGGVAAWAGGEGWRPRPAFVPAIIPTTLVGELATALGWHGPSGVLANACAAGATAIGEAWRRIRAGELDVALAGGVEAPLEPVVAAGFAALRALAPGELGARPFAAERRGLALGEGAVFLLLEERERALARRCRIYAELVGYGLANEAHGAVEPDPETRGARLAIGTALRLAGLQPYELDHVQAHATGTVRGDATEARLWHELLGARRTEVTVASSKGLFGHTLGAAGAIDAGILALALAGGLLPPNLPCDAPAPEARELRLVRTAGQLRPLRYAIGYAAGFGGVVAALLFARADLAVEHH